MTEMSGTVDETFFSHDHSGVAGRMSLDTQSGWNYNICVEREAACG